MTFRLRSTASAFFLLGCTAVHAAGASPYAGQEARDIKAMSETEVQDLLAGKGLGFAKAAELNGYPGPAHVLELAAQLQLSPQQEAQTRALHARMEAQAKASGARLVDAERELDALFRNRSVTAELLSDALRKVASAQAGVRQAHLLAHLEQARLLSAEQVARYNALRGYTGAAAGRAQESHGAGGHGHRGHR